MAVDKSYFDVKVVGRTRREVMTDYLAHAEEQIDKLRKAMAADNLVKFLTHFDDLEGFLKGLDRVMILKDDKRAELSA